jgi:hypothetical protein
MLGHQVPLLPPPEPIPPLSDDGLMMFNDMEEKEEVEQPYVDHE